MDGRRERFVAQGLGGNGTWGWVRTLGGAEAYLGLSARIPGLSVADVHAAVERGDWRVVPAVRGCMYLVPRADVPLALAVAKQLGAKRTAKDQATAGVTDAEVERVSDLVLGALVAGPGTTNGLKKRVDGGKALTFALRRLELEGRVWRRPEQSRLDHERYEWLPVADPTPIHGRDALPSPSPAIPALDPAALGARWRSWTGPAEAKDFRAWSGLSAKEAKALPPPSPVDAAGTPSRTVLLPGLDAFYGSYEAPTGVDPDLADIEVTWFSSIGTGALGGSNQPLERTVVRDGSVVGLWGWDPDARRVEVVPLRPDVAVDDAERERVEALLRDLGHGRGSTLESDDDLRARLARMRRQAIR